MNTLAVRPSPGNPRKGLIRLGPLSLRAALGRSGVGNFKHEGDGKTPRAALKILYGFWRADRVARPQTRLPMQPLTRTMLWCDAPGHPAYNRLCRLPLKASHETMSRTDHLYDICIVLDWNISTRRRGAGSAIFLHLARPGYEPTEGCLALTRRDMERLLKVVKHGTSMNIL